MAQRTQRPEETPPSTVLPDQDERIQRQWNDLNRKGPYR